MFKWRVDGFVSLGKTSINFWNKKYVAKFQKIFNITTNEIEKIEKRKDLCEVCDNWHYVLLKFRCLFDSDDIGTYSSLETELRELSSIGRVEFYCVRENRIDFTYSQSHTKYNFDQIPEKYKKFVEKISQVMVD